MILHVSPLDSALAAIDQTNLDSVTESTIYALMTGYAETWTNSRWRAVAVEQEFRLPIHNPDAKRQSVSKSFEYAGKVDLIVEDTDRPGDYYLMDHKTSSEDIADVGGDFWKRLLLSTQASHYQLACHQAGVKLAGCVWDVIRKPTIRPRKVTKAEQATLASEGTYQGIRVDEWHAQNPVESEDGHLYGLRVLADIRENPSKYFQRRIVPRSERELLEYARDLWGTSTLIRESKARGEYFRTGATHSCFQFNRSCDYLDICSGFDHEDSGRLVKLDAHSELEKPGLNIVTNSSLSCYRQCQRKYELRYVKQLGKPEQSEALYFGSAVHAALEAYWNQLLAPETEQLRHVFERSTNGNGNGERSTPDKGQGSVLVGCDSESQA